MPLTEVRGTNRAVTRSGKKNSIYVKLAVSPFKSPWPGVNIKGVGGLTPTLTNEEGGGTWTWTFICLGSLKIYTSINCV